MGDSSRQTAARDLNETTLKSSRSRRFPYLLCNHISLALCLPYLLCYCSSLALCLRAFFRSSAKHAGSWISEDCVSEGPRAHEIERQYPRLSQGTANRTKAGSTERAAHKSAALTGTPRYRVAPGGEAEVGGGGAHLTQHAPQGPGPPVPPSTGSPAPPHPSLPLRRLTRGAPRPGPGGYARAGRREPPLRRTQRRVRAGQARPAPVRRWSPPRPGAGRSRRRR